MFTHLRDVDTEAWQEKGQARGTWPGSVVPASEARSSPPRGLVFSVLHHTVPQGQGFTPGAVAYELAL